jgi:hypothetical protein
MKKNLHPVATHALRSVVLSLTTLELELEYLDTVDSALVLADRLREVYTQVDRLELLALRRAEALCGRSDVRSA